MTPATTSRMPSASDQPGRSGVERGRAVVVMVIVLSKHGPACVDGNSACAAQAGAAVPDSIAPRRRCARSRDVGGAAAELGPTIAAAGGEARTQGEESMQTLLVANPKGGSGKTTLATNIAGWLAGRKQRVVLADFDPLRSATEWLERRPPLFPAIASWTPDGGQGRDQGSQPALAGPGHARRACTATRCATPCAAPTCCWCRCRRARSTWRRRSTFSTRSREYKAVKKGDIAIGLVAMRVDPRTHSAGELEEFLEARSTFRWSRTCARRRSTCIARAMA